jgi:hypothetical protein
MKNPLLITMAGPGDIDLSEVSNFEAGIATLVLINKLYPGIKWGDLPVLAALRSGEPMKGWLTDISRSVGNIKDGIGDVLKDTFTTVGGGLGDATRLVTSAPVMDAATRAGAAYATGGGSEAARGVLGQMFGSSGDAADAQISQLMDFISGLGSTAKGTTASGTGAGFNILPWALGGVAVLGIVMIAKK